MDDTNYWETEEKLFRELMPPDGLISSADEACGVVKDILTKRVSKKRRHWLLMFALTDKEVMRPNPRKVFDLIMELKALTGNDKTSLCRMIMEGTKPFRLEYVLSPDRLMKKYEKIRAKATRGFQELRQKTYEELIGDGPVNIENLVAGALGLPKVTPETYSLPYFRFFPPILPRYAMLWLCRLGEAEPAEMMTRYGLEMEGSGEDRRPFFLGAMDIIREYRNDVDGNLIDEFLRKGKTFPHIGVREAVYRLGVELYGSEFLKDGLKDGSSAVRKVVERLKASS